MPGLSVQPGNLRHLPCGLLGNKAFAPEAGHEMPQIPWPRIKGITPPSTRLEMPGHGATGLKASLPGLQKDPKARGSGQGSEDAGICGVGGRWPGSPGPPGKRKKE